MTAGSCSASHARHRALLSPLMIMWPCREEEMQSLCASRSASVASHAGARPVSNDDVINRCASCSHVALAPSSICHCAAMQRHVLTVEHGGWLQIGASRRGSAAGELEAH